MQDLTAGLPLSFKVHSTEGPFVDTPEADERLWHRLRAWDGEGSLIACSHHKGETVHNILSDHACVDDSFASTSLHPHEPHASRATTHP